MIITLRVCACRWFNLGSQCLHLCVSLVLIDPYAVDFVWGDRFLLRLGLSVYCVLCTVYCALCTVCALCTWLVGFVFSSDKLRHQLEARFPSYLWSLCFVFGLYVFSFWSRNIFAGEQCPFYFISSSSFISFPFLEYCESNFSSHVVKGSRVLQQTLAPAQVGEVLCVSAEWER